LLDFVATICVPHSWFTSFYAVSVLLSLFWASEVASRGPTFTAVSSCVLDRQSSMGFEQVALAWLLMLVQGSRRLYECLILTQPSKSKMWVGHWALGLLFYVVTSVAVWVDGTCRLSAYSPPSYSH
jgi:3-oxo-5-alpha-steroid 4-dehydrogenase 3